MTGCVNLLVKSVGLPLSPCVMKAPRAQSRRHPLGGVRLGGVKETISIFALLGNECLIKLGV